MHGRDQTLMVNQQFHPKTGHLLDLNPRAIVREESGFDLKLDDKPEKVGESKSFDNFAKKTDPYEPVKKNTTLFTGKTGPGDNNGLMGLEGELEFENTYSILYPIKIEDNEANSIECNRGGGERDFEGYETPTSTRQRLTLSR